MKIRITLEVTEEQRRAIAASFGEPGKAPHRVVASWARMTLEAQLDSVVAEQRDEPTDS